MLGSAGSRFGVLGSRFRSSSGSRFAVPEFQVPEFQRCGCG